MRKKKSKETLGAFSAYYEIDPRRDVVEALIPFWDPKNNVFHFFDCEMIPTLEEIVGFMGRSLLFEVLIYAIKDP